MSSKNYEYKVAMTCGGCSGAIEKILTRNKDKGIEDFKVDLEGQRVFVTSSSLSSDDILNLISKSGKATSFIG
uniref:Copper transport protein ATOX1 n=1 Tax=Lepeophtheirus salmonis TaxID=72036 RepID=A0A0K2V4D0_LEPSM